MPCVLFLICCQLFMNICSNGCIPIAGYFLKNFSEDSYVSVNDLEECFSSNAAIMSSCFSALMLLARRQERHPACKGSATTVPKSFSGHRATGLMWSNLTWRRNSGKVFWLNRNWMCNCYFNIQVRENGKVHKIIKKRKRLANGLEEVRVKKRPPG